MNKQEYSIEIGGKTLTATFSDLADQANGSVIVRYGDTSVLATATMATKDKDSHFFPLTVDYEERFYAAGQILGSRYMRREGRPSDEAILSGRIIDRTIRPLFEQHIRRDIQVIITVLSIDDQDPDVVSVIATSLALGTSDIPWNGPVSCVRIGTPRLNLPEGGSTSAPFIVNPSYAEKKGGMDVETIVCGKDGEINMIEVESNEANEADLLKTLEEASTEIEKIQDFQNKIIKKIGKEKVVIEKPEVNEETKTFFDKEIKPKLAELVFSGPGKDGIGTIEDEWSKILEEQLPDETKALAMELLDTEIDDLLHTEALNNDKRADGRKMGEVRPLFAQAGGLPDVVHGSGIFYRGGTHMLSVLTLGGPGDAKILEGMEVQKEKHFMHHYNFPPFSAGETGRVGGTNRRMIGHGALAEKALKPMIPSQEDFPYTIRLVSESLASNGSTSMGSVCGSTLALMDGGVPIKRPVAGIASGLMMDVNDKTKYKVLTDIQGPEDHHGDMDFKVAGTREGVTAVQMDVKVGGIPLGIFAEAFEKAKVARLQILDTIEAELSAPRSELSTKAPKIITVQIKPDQIGMVIGGGGKTINEIRDKTDTDIDIEDDGQVYITGKGDGPQKAKEIIEKLTKVYEVGEEYDGLVIKTTDFGAFVKIDDNTEGLLHISEIAPFRIEKTEDYLKAGDMVPIKIIAVDDHGRLKFSVKDRNPEQFKQK